METSKAFYCLATFISPSGILYCVSDSPTGPVWLELNYTRKLSDQTLAMWARILDEVPVILVLKAHANTDISTQTLLLRRMRKAGLPVERLEWLPLTSTPSEHLHQYSHLDISLDCYPNCGCTTTCESLWMGVPVVTLAGNHYVSRMSTAVLSGAGLSQLVAESTDDYVSIAVDLASRITSLRSSRNSWRDVLINSPLGTASELMSSLESAFTLMAQDYSN